MRTFVIAAALPIALAACTPKPAEPPAPVMTPAEEACSALALQKLGMADGKAIVTPVSSTKTGATIYNVQAGGQEFTCTVEIDNTVSAFGPGA